MSSPPFNEVGPRNKEIDNSENKKTRPGKINNTRHNNQYDNSTKKPNENNILKQQDCNDRYKFEQ
jgi:hypothetical protein